MCIRDSVSAWRLANEHQIGVWIPHAEHHLTTAERVQLAAGTIWTDVDLDRLQGLRLRGEHSHWFQRFRGFRRLTLLGF